MPMMHNLISGLHYLTSAFSDTFLKQILSQIEVQNKVTLSESALCATHRHETTHRLAFTSLQSSIITQQQYRNFADNFSITSSFI